MLKSNVRQNKSFSWMLPVDLAVLAIGAYALYLSTDWLVDWLSHIHSGFISAQHMGWLSGWLDVLPNALLAFYYGWRGNPEVVYTSQVGDGHISIPLCIGIYALYGPFNCLPSSRPLCASSSERPRCTSSSSPYSGACPGLWAG